MSQKHQTTTVHAKRTPFRKFVLYASSGDEFLLTFKNISLIIRNVGRRARSSRNVRWAFIGKNTKTAM